MKPYLLSLLLLLPLIGIAQDEYYRPETGPAKAVYTIVLRDGTELRGEVLSQDSAGVVVRTADVDKLRLRTREILRIDEEGTRVEEDLYPNRFPQTMRVAPTAFSAEKSRVYYRNYYLYFNQFEYGLTDNWSVAGNVYAGFFINAFSLSTKVSVPLSDRVRVALNAQYAGLRFLLSDGEGIGYVQGLVTTGDQRNNTTYGLGWSVSGGDFSRNVVGTFGLVRKITPKLTFISENFALFGSGINRSLDFAGILSGGVRFDRQRHAFDVAIYTPLLIEPGYRPIFALIPFGSYHLRLGR